MTRKSRLRHTGFMATQPKTLCIAAAGDGRQRPQRIRVETKATGSRKVVRSGECG